MIELIQDSPQLQEHSNQTWMQTKQALVLMKKKSYDLEVAQYAVTAVGHLGLSAAMTFMNGIDPENGKLLHPYIRNPRNQGCQTCGKAEEQHQVAVRHDDNHEETKGEEEDFCIKRIQLIRSKQVEEPECNICYEPMNERHAIRGCEHMFCLECLQNQYTFKIQANDDIENLKCP